MAAAETMTFAATIAGTRISHRTGKLRRVPGAIEGCPCLATHGQAALAHGTRRWPALLLVGLLLLSGACVDTRPGLSVWVVPEDEEIGFDSPPSPGSEAVSRAGGQIKLLAALNETVALQVGLRTTAPPAGPLYFEVSDLAGARETLPARAAAAVFRAHGVRVESFRSWYPGHAGRPAVPTTFPDILVPWEAPRGGGPVTLNDGGTQILWIDLHVPPTLTPGIYQGQLLVRAAGGGSPLWTAALSLEVVPVAVPDRRSLPVVARVDPRDLLSAHLRWPRLAAEQTLLLPTVPGHFSAVRIVQSTMRLLHAHRVTPVLWASFPVYRPAGRRSIEVDWGPYDELVSGWLDGSALPDHLPLETWIIPASTEYPDAERSGGLESPQYARLLSAYLAECRRHFAERGWLERSVFRPAAPEPLTADSVEGVRQLEAIMRQSESRLPLVANLPARSLRGLGWQGSPAIELPDVAVWCPPGMWFEPEAMQRERKLGRRAWMMPDQPPYSGSTAVEAPPTDLRALPWIAYRYGVEGLWIEHAADIAQAPASPFGGERPAAPGAATDAALLPAPGLVHPAADYGLREEGPVASVRLKRLRRGLQDYELLRLLEANGEGLLARRLAAQIIRWAGTDACVHDLLSTREAGWPRSPAMLRLARELMLRELAGGFAPDAAARERQLAALSEWSLLFSQADRVTVSVDGVRLVSGPRGLRATVEVGVSNASNRPVEGRWTLPNPPAGWALAASPQTNAPPGTRQTGRLELDLAGLAYNTDGTYAFPLGFDTAGWGTLGASARLAVAACRRLEARPTIDGRLDDWPLASNNAAGAFLLVQGGSGETPEPTLATQAYFGLDADNLYVGIRCGLRPGEPPVWSTDSLVPVDGAMPWGQDTVEVLIDPRGTVDGTSSDLYCLQIKPSGLVVARKGCRTEPPMGTSEAWASGARAAVKIDREVWVVELALPLESLGPPARRSRLWGFNITRLDARRGEYSSWSGARGSCYRPQSMGNLLLP